MWKTQIRIPTATLHSDYHDEGINSAEFSPEGQTVVTASKDKTAKLWDLEGNLLHTLVHQGGR